LEEKKQPCFQRNKALNYCMRNVSYLLYSLKKLLLRQGLACPSCGMTSAAIVDQKYLVTSLRRCANCKLLYRAPTTSEAENKRIYQSTYKEGYTTIMPTERELEKLLASNFHGSERDYSLYIEVLTALGVQAGARVCDFGCSWGYGSWQFAKAGFVVSSCEISKPRADYAASKLGVRVVDAGAIESNWYDVFFTSHVIEHVPAVSNLIGLGMSALRPGGLFIAFTPNASAEYRRLEPKGFHMCWGFVHPQLLDWEFLAHLPSSFPLIADSSPYTISTLREFEWLQKSAIKLNGPELMFAIKKPT
jgi:2-polyprenyl-3-methyl-5-hydroxy-6-metoxy-1,4-benzoquinol methylase